MWIEPLKLRFFQSDLDSFPKIFRPEKITLIFFRPSAFISITFAAYKQYETDFISVSQMSLKAHTIIALADFYSSWPLFFNVIHDSRVWCADAIRSMSLYFYFFNSLCSLFTLLFKKSIALNLIAVSIYWVWVCVCAPGRQIRFSSNTLASIIWLNGIIILSAVGWRHKRE